MQQLQQTFLNPFQLGRDPLFIIAPSIAESANLAMLLSNEIKIKDRVEFINGGATAAHSYFNNSELSKLLLKFQNNNYKKIDEYRASLKLTMDTGFDNNVLFGLICDYQSFFNLHLDTLYPNSFFIFLYNDDLKKSPFSSEIHRFLEYNNSGFSLHVDSVITISDLTVNAVLNLKNYSNIQPNIIQNKTILLSENNKSTTKNPLVKNDIAIYDLLIKTGMWFTGGEFLFIFIVKFPEQKDSLLNKLNSIKHGFLSQPNILILAKDASLSKYIKASTDKKSSSKNITFDIYNNNISVAVNDAARKINYQYGVVDILQYEYNIVDMLLPFKTESSSSAITSSLRIDINNKLSIPKLMVLGNELSNLAFTKDAYNKIIAFDEKLEIQTALWNFCLEIAKQKVGMVYGIPSLTNLETKIEYAGESFDKPSSKELPENLFSIFSENALAIINDIESTQKKYESYIVKSTIGNAKLQSIIFRSKDEIRSLNGINKDMQQRIASLESKWYFRLANKLGHYRRIFFKQSSAGKSGFKKLLKSIVFTFTKPGFHIFRKIFASASKHVYLIAESRPVNIIYLDSVSIDNHHLENHIQQNSYNSLIRNKLDINLLREEYKDGHEKLIYKPKISIVMPVYNPAVHFLKEAIDSVIAQNYENWELCIADDCSPNPIIQKVLRSYSLKNEKIKVNFRKENGHISAASNSALALGTGDFVVLLDHDDLLTPNCLFEIVKYINAHPTTDLVYSDEDKLDGAGIYIDPFFKPDWSPDKLMATNYLSHVVAIRKQIVDDIGGFRLGFEGSQDYDLMLRCTEKARFIGHIPKILYHWRIHELSVAAGSDVKPYAYIAAKKALEAALTRRNIEAEVYYKRQHGWYQVKYGISDFKKVSIIIPTKDATAMMKNTIDSIFALTEYPNYEIIVLNNNSKSKEFFDLMEGYTKTNGDRFRCVDANFPFNFSKLMNLGYSLSTGEYLLLLNNDVEILKGDWVDLMVGHCQNNSTGAVGVKLLFPDDTIQHAGTVVGLGGIASHALAGYYKDNTGYFNSLQSVGNFSAVTAACMMYRKNVFEEVGGWDEALEVEYNDVDFCLKIIEKGYYNVYLPDVVLYHYESATRGHPHQDKKSYERHIREITYFKNKWKHFIDADPYYNSNLSLEGAGYQIKY